MGTARGALTLLLISLNVIFWTLPLLLVHFIKLLLPASAWRAFWSTLQNRMGAAWISFNNLNLRLTNPVRWEVSGMEGLRTDRWYLVVANHQSWVDILTLQRVFNGKIPFLKFFLKKELFWVPFMGLAWWALDFPFLARSATASKDLAAIRKSTEKFRIVPVSVMNFAEGTRFRPEKHQKQGSRYRHLLKPKAGGLTFVLNAMGGELDSILDVTIAYPGGAPSLWEFLCGEVEEIRVHVAAMPVTGDLLGDYAADKAYRRRFSSWLNGWWAEKDRRLGALLEDGTADPE